MRFKVDENLPSECAEVLRQAGHVTDTAGEERLSGAGDPVLFERCQSEGRILVTLDLDFSDVRLYPPGSHSGIVVLRQASQDKLTLIAVVKRLVSVFARRSPERQLWIVEKDRIRYREG